MVNDPSGVLCMLNCKFMHTECGCPRRSIPGLLFNLLPSLVTRAYMENTPYPKHKARLNDDDDDVEFHPLGVFL